MKYINTILNQLLIILPRYQFEQDVARKQANRYTKHFTAWNQLLVDLYSQITGKKSLRDIEMGLKMHTLLDYRGTIQLFYGDNL